MLSMYVSLFCETTYLSEHESSPEFHTFVLEKLFFPVSLMIPYLRMQQVTDQDIRNVHSGILRRILQRDP